VAGFDSLLTALVYVPVNVVPSKFIISMIERSSFSQTPPKLGEAAAPLREHGLKDFRSSVTGSPFQEDVVRG
jgi:hypothetical protein